MGESSALKFAAVGWTIAALAVSWAIIERRGRMRAETAKREQERESDAARVMRVERQAMAIQAMRDALDIIDRQSRSDESR